MASDYQSTLASYETSVDQDVMKSLTDNNWIIIEESEFEYYQLSLGDELIISGECIPSNYHNLPEQSYADNSLVGLKFIVVGTYSSKNYFNPPVYIADNNYILDHYREYIIHEDIPDEYYPFIGHDINPNPHVHTANFTLANKLELESFNKQLEEDILPPYIYFDLIIADTLHEAVTRPIIKQIETKKNILVLIITILIFIQFLISFIASYRKKHLIALLRMSGNKKLTVFLTLFTEHILICFIATSLFICYLFLYQADFINDVSIPSFYLFYFSYCIGTIFSTSILLIKTPMSLLFKKE